ncbi:hypothetical protein U9M48_016836 [Paspalum notatum var. saurae]|uniref:BHLH domain-containing protein n=1 Tax=Paspalum notatum var. saurae TaxID=547442 RepID=A0AAQ3WNP5_PASNO
MNRLTTTPAHHGGGMRPPPPLSASAQGGTHQHQGLARYCSAPGSLLAAIADSVTRGGADPAPPPPLPPPPVVSRFYSAESSGLTSCESSCRTTTTTDGARPGPPPSLQRAYGGSGEIRVPPPPAHAGQQQPAVAVSPLFRHSSSPAGLLSRLMPDPHGMSATRGMGSYSQAGADAGMAHGHRQLSSQWSFSRQDLPHISEMGMIPDMGESIVAGGCNSSSDGGAQSSSYLSRNFSVSSWDDTNSIMFSSPSKKPKVDAADDMVVTSFSNIDSQFGLSNSSLEMPVMDDYLQLQQDSVACRVRAKRGCATHPRSIAERERRTRISKRLKKLQDLVPNMDKQTNTSDMLDLAVEYIKELKGQVEKLKHDQANCCCLGTSC